MAFVDSCCFSQFQLWGVVFSQFQQWGVLFSVSAVDSRVAVREDRGAGSGLCGKTEARGLPRIPGCSEQTYALRSCSASRFCIADRLLCCVHSANGKLLGAKCCSSVDAWLFNHGAVRGREDRCGEETLRVNKSSPALSLCYKT
eukprot:6189080-Pleurochrysis_carterae.AAC.2